MNGIEQNERESELVRVVVGAAFEVSNTLGAGFLEKVYQRALARELGALGLRVRVEASLPVFYKGVRVGDYVADVIVDDRLIVELKCVERLIAEHVAQCLNYLRASGVREGLLINFGRPRVEWRRVVVG